MKINPIKIITILVVFIISIASSIIVVNSETISEIAKSNNKKEIKLLEFKNNLPNKNPYMIMPNPIPIQNKNDFTSTNIIDTPSEFNWKDYKNQDWTTNAKNQGNCGSCWLFGGVGALECVIKIKENSSKLNPDLSEQFVLSCLPEAGSCHGGNVEDCVYYYILNNGTEGYDCNGIIYDNCFTYESNFDYIPSCINKCQNWEEKLVPIIDYEEGWHDPSAPYLNDMMKSAIYQKGPIMAYYWVSDRFINWGILNRDSNNYYKDQNEECPYFVNHAIVLLGWKDDSSIGNGGYWICKNSWGTDWGYNGYFNIEYDTLNMGGFFAWVDYNPSLFDWPPIADSGGFYKSQSNQEITFNADESIDVDGEIISYEWDFGDGSNSTGKTTIHTYSQSGIYKVELIVTDDNGQTSNDITLAGIDQDPIEINVKGGQYFNIIIENPTNYNLYDKTLNVNYNCALISSKSREELVSVIPNNAQKNLFMSNIGFGFGTIDIQLSGIEKTERFLIIGPIVLIF